MEALEKEFHMEVLEKDCVLFSKKISEVSLYAKIMTVSD